MLKLLFHLFWTKNSIYQLLFIIRNHLWMILQPKIIFTFLSSFVRYECSFAGWYFIESQKLMKTIPMLQISPINSSKICWIKKNRKTKFKSKNWQKLMPIWLISSQSEIMKKIKWILLHILYCIFRLKTTFKFLQKLKYTIIKIQMNHWIHRKIIDQLLINKRKYKWSMKQHYE